MNAPVGWWPGFLETAGALAGCSPRAVRDLLEAADVYLGDDVGCASSLNNDGTPLEIAIALRRAGSSVRLLMDPAHEDADPVRRCRRALAACERFLEPFADGVFVARFWRALCDALPDRASLVRWLPTGAMWLAADLQRRGLAAYVSARWADPAERWPRVLGWLEQLSSPAAAALRAAADISDVASVGLEGAAAGDLRAKVYFRFRKPMPISALGLPALASPGVEHFLSRMIQRGRLHPRGLVLSVFGAFDPAEPVRVKVDLCAHCLRREPAEWAALLEELASEFRLPGPALSDTLRSGRAELAFVGFGLSGVGEPQLNSYLKAPTGLRDVAER